MNITALESYGFFFSFPGKFWDRKSLSEAISSLRRMGLILLKYPRGYVFHPMKIFNCLFREFAGWFMDGTLSVVENSSRFGCWMMRLPATIYTAGWIFLLLVFFGHWRNACIDSCRARGNFAFWLRSLAGKAKISINIICVMIINLIICIVAVSAYFRRWRGIKRLIWLI